MTKLLEFGVDKVRGLFTKPRKVWMAEAGNDWLVRDGSNAVDVLPGCTFIPDELIATPKK